MKKQFLIWMLVLFTLPALAGKPETVDEVLTMEKPPVGVVFRVDQWDHDALEWAVPIIEAGIKRLREKFPDIKLAMVSHGEEEFALMKRAKEEYAQVHKKVESIAGDNVKVHVCAGHAIMNGQSERGFVDFVEPVPAGADKVAEYMRKGYIHINVQKP